MVTRTRKSMSDADVWAMIETGRIKVDCYAATVIGCSGVILAVRPRVGRQKRAGVILCDGYKQRTIALHKLVWMAYYRRLVPTGFEIHHLEKGRHDNSIENLACVFSKDHSKLHRNDKEEFEPIPD